MVYQRNLNKKPTSDIEGLNSDSGENEYLSKSGDGMTSIDNKIDTLSESNGYKLEYIPLESLEPDPDQPRKDFSELEGLIASIKREGLIYPITVAPISSNPAKYKIIDGERRYRAYKELDTSETDKPENPDQYSYILARIYPTFEQRIGIIANLMNKGYNCFEIARSIKCLFEEEKKKDKNFTQLQLAKYLGKSATNITEYLSLLQLPDEIKNAEKNSPCVPFNKLKQLGTGKLSLQEKIAEYKRLRSEYEEKEKEQKKESENNIQDSSKGELSIKGSYSHYTALTKKLEGASKALGKFDITTIKDNEKAQLSSNLDKIIEEAKKMKKDLEEGTTQE